jgi:hypothetical protein
MRYWFWLMESRTPVDIPRFQQHFAELNPTHPSLSKEEVPQFVAEIITGEHERLIGELALAGTIARPGSVAPDRALHFMDGRFIKIGASAYSQSPYEAIELARELGWPPIKELRLEDCIQWLQSIPGLIDGSPKGRAGRAVAALSNLQHDGFVDSSVELMWAMVGLEAIYGEGVNGLAAQIFGKSQVVLGEVTQHKKRIRGLYDYRSRFVHGDLDFPVAYSPYDTYPGDDDSEKVAYDYSNMAQCMLLASIQRLVERKAMEFEFTYQLAKSSESVAAGHVDPSARASEA